MNLLSLLPKRKQPILNRAENTSFSTQSAFETQVKALFPDDHFTLLERTRGSVHSCVNPAFKFMDKHTGKFFWLEAKSCLPDWSYHIHWCTEMQLRKYLTCHKKTPTFLLLDIQHDSNSQHSLCLLSMTQACYAHLLYSCISHFEVPANQPLSSAQLWSR